MWIIMVTSGLSDMGLGVEAIVPDMLNLGPLNLERGVSTKELLINTLSTDSGWPRSACHLSASWAMVSTTAPWA